MRHHGHIIAIMPMCDTNIPYTILYLTWAYNSYYAYVRHKYAIYYIILYYTIYNYIHAYISMYTYIYIYINIYTYIHVHITHHHQLFLFGTFLAEEYVLSPLYAVTMMAGHSFEYYDGVFLYVAAVTAMV